MTTEDQVPRALVITQSERRGFRRAFVSSQYGGVSMRALPFSNAEFVRSSAEEIPRELTSARECGFIESCEARRFVPRT